MANRLRYPHSHITDIYHMLYELGMQADSSGFFFLSYAIYLSIRQPDRLLFPGEWIIPVVAKHYDTTSYAVLASIHSTASKVFPSADIRNSVRLIAVLVKTYQSNKAA